jgi:hypothetical protein
MAVGAGANGQLYNGMVLPFVNMTVKGWLWYQGGSRVGAGARVGARGWGRAGAWWEQGASRVGAFGSAGSSNY